jgi:signal transduction histidine kinase
MDTAEMVRKSIDLLSNRFQKVHIQPVIQDSNGLPKIWVDPQQMGQVMVNLFFNAIEAMPSGGTLTVGLTAKPAASVEDRKAGPAGGPACRTGGDEVIIAVTDTGHGIDPDHLSKIFRPFFTTKSKKGMGLGLSICKSIMEAHGGRISAESIPGKGTTFYLYLPVDRRRTARNESVIP